MNLNNYENINFFQNLNIIKLNKDLTNMIENIKNLIDNLINNPNDTKKEITIVYNNDNKGKIKLIGKDFVENNRKNCKILINY